MIKVGIIGGAGYTGGELIRILLRHPEVNISFVHSRSNAGKNIATVHTDLEGETDISFSDNYNAEIDVLFFCTGHGESSKLIPEMDIPTRVKIIDLSNDFRLQPNNVSQNRNFIYGLPEINKATIVKADAVANPGCFATAIQLALLPLVANGHSEDFYVTAVTGSTGAGQSLSATSHFSWRNHNIQAYKTLTHQHMGEINQSCSGLSKGGKAPGVHFVPWRGDFPRGIFASAQTKCKLNEDEIKKIYTDFYNGAAFTVVTDSQIHLKQVVNNNKCLIQIEKTGDQLVIHSIIDNLLKGASGQAVQNMNLMFGLDEKSGLNLKASAF